MKKQGKEQGQDMVGGKKSLQALAWSIRTLISNEELIRRFIYSNNN